MGGVEWSLLIIVKKQVPVDVFLSFRVNVIFTLDAGHLTKRLLLAALIGLIRDVN